MTATQRAAAALVALLVSVGAVTACSNEEGLADWSGFTVNGLEVDPPMSFDDLQRDATTVALAHAIDVTEVPPDVSGLPKDAGVVAITFEVDKWVKGDGGSEISIVRPRQPVDTAEGLRKQLPNEQVLLFALDAGYGGYLALTSDLGAIAKRDGALVTVFDEPLAPNVVPQGRQSLDALTELVR